MLHFLPQDTLEPANGAPYAEAVARLASIRRALSLVEDFSGGAEDFPPAASTDRISSAWPKMGAARQRRFEDHTRRVAGAAAAGLEALVSKPTADAKANPAAVRLLADRLRGEIERLGLLLD
jgi:hypothetical protein